MKAKSIELDDGQLRAIRELSDGSILCGGVGSGKSRTALAFYILKACRGQLCINGKGTATELKKPMDLYIITTARKRDTFEWEAECAPFRLSSDRRQSVSKVKVTIDSWNNVKKYKAVKSAFFIFDEQRAVGSGPWSRSFIEIAKHNQWILLSATPGDTWMDYVPVFIANGFFRSRSQFCREHVIFNRFCKYPKVDRYIGEDYLESLRDQILVNIDYSNITRKHEERIEADFDIHDYNLVFKDRWNVFDQVPIQQMAQVCYLLRKVVNTDPSRIDICRDLLKENKTCIVFYNFNYELEILKSLCEEIKRPYSQWNGQAHEPIPDTDQWTYLVQYTAGAEGWNCTKTNVVIFYSQNYSYKVMKQAEGRIDRRNTKYTDLYYYHLTSDSSIDQAIAKAVKTKRTFNEKAFLEL